MAVNVPGLVSIILFYIIILLVGIVAAWYKKKENLKKIKDSLEHATESEELMLAGRDIGLFVGTFTMTATWVGGGYINGTAESLYDKSKGLVWTQAPWGYALSLCIGGLLFAKRMREKKYITMLDPLQEVYGKHMGALLYIPALLGETFWSAAILSALGATLAVILDININYSVILSAAIAVGYTLFGGLYSVAFTDVVQLICIFIGLWICIPFAMTSGHVGSISETRSDWIGNVQSKFAGVWIDSALLLIFGGIPWQVYFQRVLSSTSPERAQRLSFVASAGCLVMAVPAILIGAVARSTDWKDAEIPEKYYYNSTGEIKEEYFRLILPLVLQYLTPSAIAFIGLGAVSAAVMSSADSSVLSASSMFAHNIYKIIIRTNASPQELVWVVRVGILVVAAIATIMGLTIDTIYGLWFLCSDLVYVLLFPHLLCAIYIPSVNTYGSVVSTSIGLLLRIGGGEDIIGLKPFIKYPLYDEEYGQLFPFRTLCMVITFLVLVSVSYGVRFCFQSHCIRIRYDIFGVVAREDKYHHHVFNDGHIELEETSDQERNNERNDVITDSSQPVYGAAVNNEQQVIA